ncbi:MAG: TraR/DksA C4-type zinc finger protein [Gammaproteobacteria bacterium]|nr:TraR/DksA C4-type zinc finger protein [Gammaproteobacteria bacterium]
MTNTDNVRDALVEQRAELLARLNKITSDVRHEDQAIESDFAELAVQRENDQVIDALGEAARQELTQINRALASIESGEYGLCTECGRQIRVERLEVLPYSTKCLHCASRGE